MNDETIAEMVQNWLSAAGNGLIAQTPDELVARIKGREQYIKGEFEWRDKLLDLRLQDLRRIETELIAYRGEVSSAMQTTKLTQEKLQDALSVITVLTRERDEALEIAERTHTDMHAVRTELEQQRQRADSAKKERDALMWESDDGICGHCGEGAVRVSIDTEGYPYEVFAVRYCPVCHNAWVREEPVNPDASQM